MRTFSCWRPLAGRRRQGAAFRAAAILLALAPLVLTEWLLTALGWGDPDHHADPFVGFSSTRPLFVLNDDGSRYDIPPSRQTFFRPESFDAHKRADEFRIFCLGGSTVQGRPFAVETSFTTWLELSLQAAAPERRWDVINCGGVSYASYRLTPILQEVLNYDPDLIVVYTGHNEFLEDRTYHSIKHMPAILKRSLELASRLRTYTLLREGWLRLHGESRQPTGGDRPVLSGEVQAKLDYRGGLATYHRDDRWRRDVIDHFEYNLRRMVRMTRCAGVPMLLVNPVCNIRDCPPFKSQHRDGLTDAAKAQWESHWALARRLYKSDMRRAVEHLEQALAIDDQHAGLHYELGKCWDAMDEPARAQAAYMQSKELDVCPLRILEPMNQAVLAIARQTNTPLLDARQLIERRSRHGIAGSYLLIDHVHPSIQGHQIIAEALAEQLARLGFVQLSTGWKAERDRRFGEHLASLSDFYYLEGARRLASLRGWAAGKGTLAPPLRPGPEEPTQARPTASSRSSRPAR